MMTPPAYSVNSYKALADAHHPQLSQSKKRLKEATQRGEPKKVPKAEREWKKWKREVNKELQGVHFKD